MAIRLHEIQANLGDRVRAKISHCGNLFEAIVMVQPDTAAAFLADEFIVEMQYTQVLSWRILPQYQDEESCIEASSFGPGIRIVGRVHNVIGDDADAILDIYLMAGPEFLAVSRRHLAGAPPEVGDGIEVIVDELTFWPART